tara:strand:+ start:3539 stop:4057 length:519 start_codon:yes stop_codon:yes gene_type:complete
MKNFIITLLCTTILFSCNNKKDFGVVNLEDEKTKLVEDLFKAVEKEEIGFLKELFSKDMVFVNPDGEEFNKDEFITGVEELFEMFENVKVKENNNSTDGSGSAIETTHYSTGDTWTEIWSDFSAKGKYTGKEVSFPFYIAYKWEGNKIIREMQYFNPKIFDNEREAKNMQSK